MREIQIKWEDLNSFKQDEILKDALDIAVEDYITDKDGEVQTEVIWQDGHYFTGLTENDMRIVNNEAQRIVLRTFEFPPVINLE